MRKDYSKKNLQKASFINQDLTNASFYESDLRGADFSGSNLTAADLTHVKTGITPSNMLLTFLAALAVSAFSGYVAMLAGNTIQTMLASNEINVRLSGIVTMVTMILFVLFSIWKGVGNALKSLVLPVSGMMMLIALVLYVFGLGRGRGLFYLILSFLLVGLMFVVGTVARAAAGSLSNILFVVVALGGGLFGKSLGGGIGTVVMAISCAVISKRALSGAPGFGALRIVSSFITAKFGTSFRRTKLAGANFSRSNLRNADFSNADVSSVNWADSKKINCID